MILLVYHQTSGYRLFNPINKQLVMSRDVVFDGWNWTSNTYEQYKRVVNKFEEVETIEEQSINQIEQKVYLLL